MLILTDCQFRIGCIVLPEVFNRPNIYPIKRITYFLSGALAALLISSATVSAFAAGGLITLNVQPAQVMVNGEVFQPKDEISISFRLPSKLLPR